MKKFLIALACLAALAGIAAVTCPDKQAHKDAIMSVVNEKINESLDPSDLSIFAESLGTALVGIVLENRLTVKNYFVFSTGALRDLDDLSRTVSVGVFGHVFTFSKEDLDRALEELV